MAETGKTEFRAVDVTLDAEGNAVVKPIVPPTPPVAEEEESQEAEEQEQEESQEGGGSEVEGQEEQEAEEEAEEEEGSEVEEQQEAEEEEDDIVSYDELPEAVQKYLDFLEDTGGSLEDFISVNRDFEKLPQDDVIREFLKKTNPYLDADDIEYEMKSRFGIDEDTDSDSEIRAKKVAKKKFYGEAIKSLKTDGEKYKADLASSSALPQQAKDALDFKKQFETQRAAEAKAVQQKVSSFVRETNKVLGKDFKGFEVKVGDKSLIYKPSDVKKTREENLNVNNLLGRFTDKEGNVKDVAGYHKALTFASNPDAVAAHFFELGKAAAVEESAKGSRNIKMDPRQVAQPRNTDTSKFKFVELDSQQSKNAKIKLRNY